jgi:RNA polymerase sigma factor FliA
MRTGNVARSRRENPHDARSKQGPAISSGFMKRVETAMKPKTAANCAISLAGPYVDRRHQPCEQLGLPGRPPIRGPSMQSPARQQPIGEDDYSDSDVAKNRLQQFERPSATGKSAAPPSPADNAARDELILTHRDLVRSIARTFHFSMGKSVDLEDLEAYGDKGLVEAASRFDPTRGVPFGAFAWRRIEGSIVDGIRAHGPFSRRAYERLRAKQARPANDTGSDFSQAPDLPAKGKSDDWRAEIADPGEACDEARWNGRRMVQLPPAEDDSREVLAVAALRRLPKRERRLFQFCYYQGKTLTEAAREMGNGCSWASRLHAEGLATLRAAIETRASSSLPPGHPARKHWLLASRSQKNTTDRKDDDRDGRGAGDAES